MYIHVHVVIYNVNGGEEEGVGILGMLVSHMDVRPGEKESDLTADKGGIWLRPAGRASSC